MTEHQIMRLTKDLSAIAKEPITVEHSKGAYYAFGSELAVLRLFHKYNSPKCRAGYSENMKTWYFSIETRFQEESAVERALRTGEPIGY